MRFRDFVTIDKLDVAGDLLVMGSFSVIGSASVINATNLTVSDPIILLGASQSGLPVIDEGLMFGRGTGLTQAFIWDESDDTFALIGTNDGANVIGNINIDSYSNLRVNQIRGSYSIFDNVNITTSTFSEINTKWIDFELSSQTSAIGRLSWNSDFNSLYLGLTGGNVNLVVGQDIAEQVFNGEATTLLKGEVVYIDGAQGDKIKVKRASNLSDTTSAKTLGVVAENILSSQIGYVVSTGVVTGLNLSIYNTGDILWLGATAGTYTVNKPQAPNHIVFVGVVLKNISGNGLLYVKPQNGYELEEIHDVLISGTANGDLLSYDATVGLWKNRTTAFLNIATGSGTTNYIPKWSSANNLSSISSIYDNGNVGIGKTSSIGVKLNIRGEGTQSSTKSLLVEDSTGKELLIIRDDSRVFLSSDFEVGFGNNPNCWNNVVLGRNALQSFSGPDNGGANIAIGNSSQQNVTTSLYNVGVGHWSLKNTTIGSNNTAINYSLINNITGDNNIAIGYGNLNVSTSSNYNLAIGRENLSAFESGSYNTAIGPYATLTSLVNGSNNLVIGRLSATYLETGSNNTIVGNLSMQSVQSAGSNLSKNTIVGYNNVNSLITGKSNTVIGAFIQALSDSMTNHILIGDGDGQIRIVSNQDGNIGIGLTGPTNKLHVYSQTIGGIRLEDGSQGSNYILVSDSNGVGSWTHSYNIVGTTVGLTTSISSGVVNIDMNWGGTSSGLTFSSNAISLNIDDTTLKINSIGKLEVIAGSAQPIYQLSTPSASSGDNSTTGLTLSSVPNDYSRVQVFVNGQLQKIGNGVKTEDCYFSNDGGTTALAFVNLTSGDTLYWNGLLSGFELEASDEVEIIYET